jgi:hypothetical protein
MRSAARWRWALRAGCFELDPRHALVPWICFRHEAPRYPVRSPARAGSGATRIALRSPKVCEPLHVAGDFCGERARSSSFRCDPANSRKRRILPLPGRDGACRAPRIYGAPHISFAGPAIRHPSALVFGWAPKQRCAGLLPRRFRTPASRGRRLGWY